MALQEGTTAPGIRTPDFTGQPVDTAALAGRPLMISFFRYASCPICNLRMRELVLSYPDLHARGLEHIAVVESPAASVQQYMGRHDAPFPIIADPDRTLYRRFHVEPRWTALLSLPALATAVRAFARGFLPGRIDGAFHGRPAEFLIGPDGKLALAYYAATIDDHLPLDRVRAWLGAIPAREVRA